MTTDFMSVVVDWLDSYRDGNVSALLDLYEDEAVIRCECTGRSFTGKSDLGRYWQDRIQKQPASELVDIRPDGSDVVVSYLAGCQIVEASFGFSPAGRISSCRCGPAIGACQAASL